MRRANRRQAGLQWLPWLRALAALQTTVAQVPAPMWWLTPCGWGSLDKHPDTRDSAREAIAPVDGNRIAPARPLSPSSVHSRLYSATRRGWEAAESTEYLWPSAGCEGQSPVVAAISPGLSVPGSK